MQQREISNMLDERLKHPQQIPTTSADLSRQLRHFPIRTRILFRDDAHNQRTQMEVIAGDRPGLLARIARGMLECETLLQNAKIATFGERAEDIFFVTNHQHQPLNQKEQDCLRETISLLLEE
jgi:[protein-PII] uridylyltransferase